MKKALKSIARSMKILEEYHVHTLENWNEFIWMQKQNLGNNNEILAHSRDANRILLKRFELEHAPLAAVLEGLLGLVAVERITDEKSQEVVDEAKRMIGLMKAVKS